MTTSLAKLGQYFEKEPKDNFIFLNEFEYSKIEKTIADLTNNITQINSHNICVAKDSEGFLLSYPALSNYGNVDYRPHGMNIKFLESKEQLVEYIKHDKEFENTLSCFYSQIERKQIKALMVESLDNIHNNNKDNNFIKTVSNKVKESRAVYFNTENINKPTI